MQSLQTVNDFIAGLEAENTTLKNCLQLASLYIVKEHLENTEVSQTEKEINDILPTYRVYADVKSKYSRHELTEESVVSALQSLCTEIKELIKILYANTEMAKERKEIYKMVTELYNEYDNS